MTSKVIQTFTGNDVVYKVIKDGYKTVTETIHVTDSMPTRTEYNVSPSSVVHNPNLNYTIDTSHTYPPVITFNDNVVTPDDVEITRKEYVLAPYGQEYVLIDGDGDQDNFMRVGNVIIKGDGSADNFDGSNWIWKGNINPLYDTHTWEIRLKIKTGSNVSWTQGITGNNITDQRGIRIDIHESNWRLYVSNGSNWINTSSTATGSYIVLPNTIYWIRAGWTGTEYYLDYSLDGEIYATDINYLSNVAVSGDGTFSIGCMYASNTYYPFYGTVYLAETKIIRDNDDWWVPTWNKLGDNYVRSGLIQDTNGILENFGNNSGTNFVKIMNFLPGSQPFEIKTRIYLANTSNVKYLFGSMNSTYANPRVQINTDGKLHVYLSANGSSWNITNNSSSSSTISLNTWHTIQFIWTGSIYKILVDGTQYWSINSTSVVYRNANDPLCFGCYNGTSRFESGKIDLSETYIYYNSIESWKYKTLNALYGNVANGPVITNNKIVSNFSTSNYIQLNQIFNPGNNPWLMQFKFKQNSLDSEWRALFGSYSGDYTCGAHFYLTQSGGISFELTSTNSSWNITNTGGIYAGNVFTANKWYWARLEFTGTAYNAYISDDGVNFRQISTLATTTAIRASQKQTIGCDQYAGSNHYINGSIDFSESYIKINNEYWWNGSITLGKHLPGILDSTYEDDGSAVTLNLYDVETSNRSLILNTNRNVTVTNKKFVQYDGQIQIPDHGLSIYDPETYNWSKYRFITLNVDNASTTIYTEGNI